IRLKNCAFFARPGVREEAEGLGQRCYVDADRPVGPDEPLDWDSMAATVGYGTAFQAIEATSTGKRRCLIGALALEVGKALCERFPQIVRAEITIRKPNAPVPGVLDHVEVTVVWPQ